MTTLAWHKPNDWTLTTTCARYQIKRQLNWDKHPMCNWEYLPKSLAELDRTIGAGRYNDSKSARQACEDDLQQPPPVAASTTTQR